MDIDAVVAAVNITLYGAGRHRRSTRSQRSWRYIAMGNVPPWRSLASEHWFSYTERRREHLHAASQLQFTRFERTVTGLRLRHQR